MGAMLPACRALLLGLALTLLTLAACGGGERTPEPVPLSGPLREMLEEVAAARGLEAPDDLMVVAVAPEDIVEVYTGLFAEEDREALQEGGALYQLLGYIEPDESYWDVTVATAEYWVGFYSSADKTLWVVTEQEEIDVDALSDEERVTLVHEMAHAVQDHNFGLRRSGSRIASTLDGGLAWTSVVEGDAMVSTALWQGHIFLRPAGGVEGPVLLLANVSQAQVPPQILRTLYFPYINGEIAMRNLAHRRGLEAVNALFAIPPPSTAHILHPRLLDSGWLPASVSHLLPGQAIGARLGADWTETESGVLGEFHLANYLLGSRPGIPHPWAWGDTTGSVEAAEGWRGDAYRLFESGEERVLAVVVRFGTVVDARQFQKAHGRALARWERTVEGPYTFVTRDDGFVVGLVEPPVHTMFFAIGTSAEVVRAALGALEER